MPWLLVSMKDVICCDKLRGLAIYDVIRRFPNGETRRVCGAFYKVATWGTETSKYPEEKKTIVIPRVVASEIGKAQTKSICVGLGL